ncbi:OadG family protein [Aliikangiella maris]|uniref:Oxaloacetate decarboxylase gamma chain n=2 Tax=Aliikangiella maris TaxID=3162458 RepID=A0ABV3MJX9_9GAMM
MNESNLIFDGVILMLTGMGTVFIFLTILVFFTGFLQRFAKPEPTPITKKTAQINDDEVAAVSAAVYAYRQNNTKN